MSDINEVFGPAISTYSRQQAIEDGVLVQLSGPGYEGDEWIPAMVKEVGIGIPVAMTIEAFELVVALSPAAERACNDLQGRLWDVLHMFRTAVKALTYKPEARRDRIEYEIRCVTKSIRPSRVKLVAVCGPDDIGTPCITICLPGQD